MKSGKSVRDPIYEEHCPAEASQTTAKANAAFRAALCAAAAGSAPVASAAAAAAQPADSLRRCCPHDENSSDDVLGSIKQQGR